MRGVLSLVAFAFLVTGAGAASAQPGDHEFHDRTLRALERIERALERLERRLDEAPRPGGGDGGAGNDELVAASSDMCGFASANCQREAERYCTRLNYARGVPLRIELRGNTNFMVRVRCFN